MGKKETLDALATVPLLEGLSKKEIEHIYKAGSEFTFRPGHTIVAEGAPGAAFHLILEGTVKVVVKGRTKRKLGRGDYFGEMALIDHAPRMASVVAEDAVRTFSIASWSFLPILDHNPSIARKMLVIMTERLRDAEQNLTH